MKCFVGHVLLAFCMLAFGSPRAHAADSGIEFHYSAELAGLPFSESVRAGGLLFLSGQIGTVKGPELVAGGIRPETRQALENIQRAVEASGSSMDRIVKCTVMLADIAEWPAMNEVYVEFFDEGRYPARSAFATTGLALGARVEIECIAAVGQG